MKWMRIKYMFNKTYKKQIFDGFVTKLCKGLLQEALQKPSLLIFQTLK